MTSSQSDNEMWAWHDLHGFRRIINVSGTMTGLGASVTNKSVQEAVTAAMGHFVNMHELQGNASAIISRLTGAEAGFMTASASAGITLAIAGCMTGLDPARAEALPRNPGAKNEVVVQAGHLCGYGAPIDNAIALAGAKTASFGQSTLAMDHQMRGAINDGTAAALYVVSHHVVHYGQLPFDTFVEIAHEKNLPVIVDAASEYDLEGFLKRGADIVIYSAHKFMSGPTGGIVAGRKDLIRAAYLQNIGVGRGMKIGKESIAGAIQAMENWMTRDHEAAKKREQETLENWKQAISGINGIRPQIVADPTGNPLNRLQVNVDPSKAGASAATFARVLAEQDIAIIVRNHEVELGYFQLDPCNLLEGQAEIVSETLREVLSSGAQYVEQPGDLALARNGGVDSYLKWQS